MRHETDAHWTGDGEVRLSYLEEVVGAPVSRDDVRKVVPAGFSRKAPNVSAIGERSTTIPEAAPDLDPVMPIARVAASVDDGTDWNGAVSIAEQAQLDRKLDVRNARDRVLACRERASKAQQEFAAQFPVISREKLVNDHCRHEQQVRADRVAGRIAGPAPRRFTSTVDALRSNMRGGSADFGHRIQRDRGASKPPSDR